MSPTKGNGNGAPEPPLDETAAEERSPAADEGGLEPVETGGGPDLEREVAALRRERDDLKDAVLRRRADFENYRKRVERDQQASAQDAAADALRKVLDTVDNLERALAAPGGEEALRHGVDLTLRKLLAALEGQGVEVVSPLGQRFDPQRHEALVHEPAPGVPAGTVAEVFRKGYTYKERLLRAALVRVSSGEGPADGGEGGDGGGGDLQ